MLDESLPNRIQVAIIGAGPQALTLVTHLLQKRAKLRPKIMVFDPSGTWLSQWQHQFAAQDILHLRSPAVHHPDPDPFALRRFAENRSHELFPSYDLPGTQLFAEFCQDVIQRWQLQHQVYPAKVAQWRLNHSGYDVTIKTSNSPRTVNSARKLSGDCS